MTRLITLEGGEGCYKSTQTQMLVDYLRGTGASVLQVKEPGTPQLQLTLELRKIMLDQQYDSQHTALSRELVSQAIRSIHLNKLIIPAIDSNKYDFIISDRGVLSSVAYASALGHSTALVNNLTEITHRGTGLDMHSYDVVLLKRYVSEGLEAASQAKQEFAAGDAMELRGVEFLEKVNDQFEYWSSAFKVSEVDVNYKDKQTILNEITTILGV